MPRIRPFIVFGLLAATCLSPSGTIYAETQHGHRHEPLPNVTEYLDRLDRPERDQDQKPAQVIEALQLKPGMDVADLGAGSGYFTRRFVDAVTESGTVYVIDVEPKALKHVEQSLAALHQPYRAEFVLAGPDDPKLPAASADLVFICNTYHHLEDRATYLPRLRRVLKPDGRIVVIDFYHDERSGDLGFPKQHLVPRDRVIQDMMAAGFRLTKEHHFLPKQYFLEFTVR